MWDQAGFHVKVVECGQTTFCTRFGGEGTGAKTYINFNKWQLGKQYGFMIRSYDVGATLVRQEGYLFAAELGGWVLLSILEVVKKDAKRPWQIEGMYSFVEQFSYRDFGDARWARFGPSFVQYEGEEEWQQIRNSTFIQHAKPGENAINCYANVTNGDLQWGLGIGGAVGRRSEGELLTVARSKELPPMLQLFDQLDQAGKLPRGCPDGTCTDLLLSEVYYFFFLPGNLPRTFVIAGMLLAATVSCLGCLRLCCCSDDDDGHAPVAMEGLDQVECPKKHALRAFIVPNHTFNCDGCGRKVPAGCAMHGCRLCNYSLCESCVAKRLEAAQSIEGADEA